MINDYSTKELQMFVSLGYEDIIVTTLPPPNLYRIAAEEAFINDSRGSAVESLRKCCKALRNCKVYRMTPEWDEMITVF